MQTNLDKSETVEKEKTRIGFSINVYSGILSPFVPIQAILL
jgi:hypothetical protein